MDKGEAHRPAGTIDAHATAVAEARPPARGLAIDGRGAQDTTDLKELLGAIAARIDVVLDEKVAAGAEPEGRHRAARAWSSVVGKRATEATSDMRRQALATTILRRSTGRRPGRDDGHEEIADGNEETADGDAPQPARAVVGPVSDVTSGRPPPAAADRSDVEDRLRAARKRLAARPTTKRASGVHRSRPRASRLRRPGRRKAEVQALVRPLLIGAAIVAASAVVSILLT